jgi:hypothetical protein
MSDFPFVTGGVAGGVEAAGAGSADAELAGCGFACELGFTEDIP